MRISKSIWKTLKEDPADAEIPSHKLMIRAGLIHKVGAGIYNWMPIGLKIVQKIEKIIREEHNKIGCQEVMMSVITPGELWQKSGRWQAYGDEMLKFKDKGNRDLCISPTNEETVTDLFASYIKSYKDLPLTLYQINTKFRDEIRPRFGVMRAREFVMKDAYSFHQNKESLDKTYWDLYKCYSDIFTKIGLKFQPVEADPGAMASADQMTHEFQVLANNGEDQLVVSEDFACNIEKAKTKRAQALSGLSTREESEVATGTAESIEDVATLLKVQPSDCLKSLLYFSIHGEKATPVLVVLLGDDNLNELKLKNYLNADRVILAKDDEIRDLNLIKGVLGPKDVKTAKIIFDSAINLNLSYVIGANKKGLHLKGYVPGTQEVADLRLAREGDVDDKGKPVRLIRGIEVGHIFQLGKKYTESMGVTILGPDGKSLNPLMGCYGIGVTRVIGAAIEQANDEKGIIWPKAIAPFDVHFVAIWKNKEFIQTCDSIYDEMKAAGFDVIYDDRDAGPGFKFKDADLLGCPLQVACGERDYSSNSKLQITIRKSGEKIEVERNQLVSKLKELMGN